MKLQRIFLFCVLVALCACATSTRTNSGTSAFANLSALRSRYPLVERATTQSYLDSLTSELSTRTKATTRYRLELYETSRPFAVSPATDVIALSTGLVLRCQSESELAFILAHELAHHELKHVVQMQTDIVDNARSKEFELEADRYAVRAMLRAGINPLGSRDALIRFHPLLALEDSRYPSLEERRENIEKALSLLPMIGAIDSRRFRSVQDELRG